MSSRVDDQQYAGGAGEGDYGEGGGGDDVDFEADLAAIEAMNAEAEAENDKIQGAVTDAMGTVSEAMADKAAKEQEQKERDSRSVFVSNCHWEATGEEVAVRLHSSQGVCRARRGTRMIPTHSPASVLFSPQSYFSSCGPVERVTILEDKFGTRKGCVAPFQRRALARTLLTAHPRALDSTPTHPDFVTSSFRAQTQSLTHSF